MYLVAYGAQDVYLTGNPQITFFKVVYRRHTNFACEAIEQTFNGNPTLGGKSTVQITRNGDLVTKMWLKTTMTKAASAVTDAGYQIINSVELQIGGTKIDKHYGRWMHVWSQLTRTDEHLSAHTELIAPATATTSATLYVPLQFFCCRNDGLALPLIALQYHDVRLEFDFATVTNVTKIENTTLLVNYVYLDSEERKRFAQASHEYLIEQLQFTGVETVATGAATEKVRLNFNHPVKELVWGIDRDFGSFDTTGNAQSISTGLLQLNGHDRFSAETGKYFNYVQPHTHHTKSPSLGLCVYSFALNPEEHQPSGTCNFSRIDNATLTLTTPAATGTNLYVYGVNYNVLRIMSGMGGVAYSN